MKPKISVLMSVYNNQSTVGRAIESILKQTYENIELVLIDDCSTDDSFKIMGRYAFRDRRVKLSVNKVNVGLTRSLNIALGKSSGDVIARQDADDWSDLERFEHQLKMLKKFDLVGTDGFDNEINKKITTLHTVRYSDLCKNNQFIHGSVMFRRKVYDAVGSYDDSFRYSQDYEYFLRIAKAGYKLGNLKIKLYNIGVNKNKISIAKAKEQAFYRTFAKLKHCDMNGNAILADFVKYIMFKTKSRIL